MGEENSTSLDVSGENENHEDTSECHAYHHYKKGVSKEYLATQVLPNSLVMLNSTKDKLPTFSTDGAFARPTTIPGKAMAKTLEAKPTCSLQRPRKFARISHEPQNSFTALAMLAICKN
jgi:hypothetical protein